MHVKRHLNRLFGSFRNKNGNSSIKTIKESKWELVDDDTCSSQNVTKSPTLNILQRTFSSKRRKHKKNQEERDENEQNAFEDDKELSQAVKEINNTIGLLQNYGKTSEINEQTVNENWATFEQVEIAPVEELITEIEQNFANFEQHFTDQVFGVAVEMKNGGSALASGSKFYHRILGKRQLAPSSGGLVRSSFRKVLRKRNQQEERTIDAYTPTIVETLEASMPKNKSAGFGKKLKKGLVSFGRSMKEASTSSGMMPCECPALNEYDFTRPSRPWEDDDTFYEFRRYCETESWQKQQKVQAGFCPPN